MSSDAYAASAGTNPVVAKNKELPWPVGRYVEAINAVEAEVLDIILPIAAEAVMVLVAELDAACARQDSVEIVRTAHTLKSTGGYLGARPVVWHALSIEHSTKAQHGDELRDLLAGLKREIAQFLAAIDEVCRQRSARA